MNFDRGLVLQELDRKRVQLHADAAASLHNTDVSQRQRANVSAAVCHCLEAAQGPRAAAAAAVAINAGGRPDGVLQDSDQRTNERLNRLVRPHTPRARLSAARCPHTPRPGWEGKRTDRGGRAGGRARLGRRPARRGGRPY